LAFTSVSISSGTAAYYIYSRETKKKSGSYLYSSVTKDTTKQLLQFVLDMISYQLHIEKLLSADAKKTIYTNENEVQFLLNNYIKYVDVQQTNKDLQPAYKNMISVAFDAFSNVISNPWPISVMSPSAIYEERPSANVVQYSINIRGPKTGQYSKISFSNTSDARAALAVYAKAYIFSVTWSTLSKLDYTPYDTYSGALSVDLTSYGKTLIDRINTESKTLTTLLSYDLTKIGEPAATTIRNTIRETKIKINLLFAACCRILLPGMWTSTTAALVFDLAKAAGLMTKELTSPSGTVTLSNLISSVDMKNRNVVSILRNFGCRTETDVVVGLPAATLGKLKKVVKTFSTAVVPTNTTTPTFKTSPANTAGEVFDSGTASSAFEKLWSSLPLDPAAAQTAYAEWSAKKFSSSDVVGSTNQKTVLALLRAIVLMSYTDAVVDEQIAAKVNVMKSAALALIQAAQSNRGASSSLFGKAPDIKALSTAFEKALSSLMSLINAEQLKLTAGTGSTATDDTSSGEPPTGETSTGETPTGETPTGETPTGETPTGETPTGETPTGETPTGETSPEGGLKDLIDNYSPETEICPPGARCADPANPLDRSPLPAEDKPWYVRHAAPLVGVSALAGFYFFRKYKKK
jgi:hypothetical protein